MTRLMEVLLSVQWWWMYYNQIVDNVDFENIDFHNMFGSNDGDEAVMM